MARFLCAVMALLLGGCFIFVKEPDESRNPLADHDAIARLAENAEAVYRMDNVLRGGHGTGYVVSHEGHFITSAHVAESGQLSIMLYENGVTAGKPLTYQAKVLAVDEFHDIALLKVDRKFRHPVILEDDKNIRPGDEVYSYGYPYDFGLMLTRGNLMRKNYSESGPQRADDGSLIHIVDMTLTDFMAGPGTSGAGVFLVRTGKLIGMMRLLSPKGYNAVSLMVPKALTPVPVIELLLKANRVPYLLPDGTVATYPPQAGQKQ